LDRAGSCPPEDSNGLDGNICKSYENFLAEYKKHPKRIRLKEAIREINRSAQKYCNRSAQNYFNLWMGAAIRIKPLNCDIDCHSLLLTAMIAGPSVKKKGTLGIYMFKESISGCANCGNHLRATMKCSKCSKVACKLPDVNCTLLLRLRRYTAVFSYSTSRMSCSPMYAITRTGLHRLC
jgi:hypothetical protein